MRDLSISLTSFNPYLGSSLPLYGGLHDALHHRHQCSAGGYKYELLVTICCVLGLFEGCLVTLHAPIAFDLCGPAGASQAIGSLLALFSLPMTVQWDLQWPELSMTRSSDNKQVKLRTRQGHGTTEGWWWWVHE